MKPNCAPFFIEGKTELKEFPFFKPLDWKGKSLRIPIDYIALSSMGAANSHSAGPVYANIYLGEHLIFWEQLIFDGEEFRYGGPKERDTRDAICNERVVEAINHLLEREDVRKRIRYLSDTNGRDFSEDVFTNETSDCVKKKLQEREIPHPVRFY